MKTGALSKYIDRIVNYKMSTIALDAIENARQNRLVYKQMNQMSIDALMNQDGIVINSGLTYRGSAYFDIGGADGYFVTRGFQSEIIPQRIGLVLRMDSNDATISAFVARDINNGTGVGNFVTCSIVQIGSPGYYRSAVLIDVSGQPAGQSVGAKIQFTSSTAKVQGIGVYYR